MAYTPKNWNDLAAGNTPILATELNRIEAGVNEAINLPGNMNNLPPGATLTVRKLNGVWPQRPTGRTDVTVQWVGPDPDPNIVTSGTAGAIDGVDVRMVTP